MQIWDTASRSVRLGGGAFLLSIGFTALAGAPAAYGADYPPVPPNGLAPTMDLQFRSACAKDVPYIEYAITPIEGASGPARLTFINRDDQVVEVRVVDDLVGRTIFPGAAADGDGNGTDWPGVTWSGGQWIDDPADALVRQGLRVVVEVGSTASTSFGYVPGRAPCYGPLATTTSPPTASGTGPPQGASRPDGTGAQLPNTGSSDLRVFLPVATAALLAGLMITYGTVGRSRRRTGSTGRLHTL